jgi:hypothetical protein
MVVRLGSLVVLSLGAFLLVSVHQRPLADEPETKEKDPFLRLNQAFRKAYAGHRKIVLGKTSPIVIANGDDLILYREGKRTPVKFMPALYHDLKVIDHVPLAIFSLIKPISGDLTEEERVELRRYREVVQTGRDALDKRWPEPKTLARQQEILDASLKYLDQVLQAEKGPLPDLQAFCRRMAPVLMVNAGEAARAQIDAMNAQMLRWRQELSKDEWGRLQVIVIGSQMPRRGNLAVQYFSLLLGLKGEGPRLTYAEALWEEPAALRLLGTRLVDTGVGAAFFDDDQRMFRDLLADAATEYLRTFKVEP